MSQKYILQDIFLKQRTKDNHAGQAYKFLFCFRVIMAKYWIDTCVWRDFYEDRFSKSGKPLGEYATKAFMKILKKRDKILFSESLIKELQKDYKKEEVNKMLNLLFISDVLIRVEIKKEEYLEAKTISESKKLPFVDCLNAIQARNHQAIIVSQDEHFTKILSSIVGVVKPQDV